MSPFSGLVHEANLDVCAMWPTAFALKELTAAEEARIVALVRKAVSCGLGNPMATERVSSSGGWISFFSRSNTMPSHAYLFAKT